VGEAFLMLCNASSVKKEGTIVGKERYALYCSSKKKFFSGRNASYKKMYKIKERESLG